MRSGVSEFSLGSLNARNRVSVPVVKHIKNRSKLQQTGENVYDSVASQLYRGY